MKSLKSYSALLAASAALVAAGYAATPTAAEVAAPSKNMMLSLSYDYYDFNSQWGGFKAAQAYYGPNDVFDAGDRDRKGSVDGGTVSLGWGAGWSIDASFRSGSSSINLPNTYTQTTAGTTVRIRFLDRVSFRDRNTDLRLRKIILNKAGWAGYAALGYYNQNTDQKYRTSVTSATATPAGGTAQDISQFFTQGVQSVAALTGSAGQTFGSLGVGVAKQFKLADAWFLAIKAEGAGLAGKAETQSVTQGINISTGAAAAGTGAGASKSVYGGKAGGSVRLSYSATPALTLALEGGLEYWGFVNSGNTSSQTSGILGRAVAQYRF
ncbi:MAG: hypothetical protein FJ399_11980 [Verrucomicrobia bacterium]|nr:hypothetical protein [Verrucomicrobiota bacterium]